MDSNTSKTDLVYVGSIFGKLTDICIKSPILLEQNGGAQHKPRPQFDITQPLGSSWICHHFFGLCFPSVAKDFVYPKDHLGGFVKISLFWVLYFCQIKAFCSIKIIKAFLKNEFAF